MQSSDIAKPFRFQFGIRQLFLLSFVASLVLLLWLFVRPYRNDALIAQRVTNLGGRYSGSMHENHWLGLVAPTGPTRIEVIDLSYSDVADDDLPELLEAHWLRDLSLIGTRITNDGARCIAGAKELRVLRLSDTCIGDNAMPALGELPQLETLSLDGTCITDHGLRRIGAFNSLRTLTLANTPITNKGLAYVSHVAGLRALDIEGTQISDNGLHHLAGLRNLEVLSLNNTNVSDEAISTLASMQGLKWLSILDTNITYDGFCELRALLPNCDIIPPIRFHPQGGGVLILNQP